jgi:hypothetical protein
MYFYSYHQYKILFTKANRRMMAIWNAILTILGFKKVIKKHSSKH